MECTANATDKTSQFRKNEALSELERLKVNIHCAIVPEKYPISAYQVNEFYKQEFNGGKDIPFADFGFRDLDAFLGSMKDSVQRSRDINGAFVYNAKLKDSTRHISEMVAKQKSAVKTPLSNYSASRRSHDNQSNNGYGNGRYFGRSASWAPYYAQSRPFYYPNYYMNQQYAYEPYMYYDPAWISPEYTSYLEGRHPSQRKTDSEKRPRINMDRLQRQLTDLGSIAPSVRNPRRISASFRPSAEEDGSLPSTSEISSSPRSLSPDISFTHNNEPLRISIKQDEDGRQVTNLTNEVESFSIQSSAPFCSATTDQPTSSTSPLSLPSFMTSPPSTAARTSTSVEQEDSTSRSAPVTGLIHSLYQKIIASEDGSADVAQVAEWLQLRSTTNAIKIVIGHYSRLFELQLIKGAARIKAKPEALPKQLNAESLTRNG